MHSSSDDRTLTTRKRRAYRKSRAGCRNCKLRKVKCDETQPACRNCIRLLVTCNYDSSSPSEASSTVVREDDLSFSLPETNLVNDVLVTDLNRMVVSQYPQTWGSNKIRALDKYDIDRLKRWHTRTVFTMGPNLMALCYQLTVRRQATEYPYLLHAALAMAAMHDGYLGANRAESNSREAYYYHNSCAAALFNHKLSSGTFTTADRDAIWTTACLLSNMSSFVIEADNPEQSWPLSQSSSSTLEWLEMQRGMKAIYQLCSITEPGGMFYELLQHPKYSFLQYKWVEDTRDGIEDILPEFVTLCSLTPLSNAQNSPYHLAVRALSAIWDMECTQYTVFRFLSFASLMRSEMKELLMKKDAPALVILAYWYTKIFRVHRWWHNRAVVECAAICIYLRRYHYSNSFIMHMLKFPLSKLEDFAPGITASKSLDALEFTPSVV